MGLKLIAFSVYPHIVILSDSEEPVHMLTIALIIDASFLSMTNLKLHRQLRWRYPKSLLKRE